MPVLDAGAGAGASNTRMLIRKERFAGRDRADPREPCANDVECGGRVGNGGVCWSRAKVEGSIEKKLVSITCSQGVDTVGVIGEGGAWGKMGHWGMGAGINRMIQTTVTYLGRYIQARSAVHVATRSYFYFT